MSKGNSDSSFANFKRRKLPEMVRVHPVTHAVIPVAAPKFQHTYASRRDSYIELDEEAWASRRRREKLPRGTVAGGRCNPQHTVAGGRRNPQHYDDNEHHQHKVPIAPDIEQTIHRGVYDVVVVLGSKSVHCRALQDRGPAIQFIPITSYADIRVLQQGQVTEPFQFNIFIGQTPDVYPDQQVALIQQFFYWWISAKAQVAGFRTVRPHGNRPRHFHTFNLHQEWWDPTRNFFDGRVLMEPGGAWIAITDQGRTDLRTFISDYKSRPQQERNLATPVNCLVIEKTGEIKGGVVIRKRKVDQPAPIPTSSNPYLPAATVTLPLYFGAVPGAAAPVVLVAKKVPASPPLSTTGSTHHFYPDAAAFRPSVAPHDGTPGATHPALPPDDVPPAGTPTAAPAVPAKKTGGGGAPSCSIPFGGPKQQLPACPASMGGDHHPPLVSPNPAYNPLPSGGTTQTKKEPIRGVPPKVGGSAGKNNNSTGVPSGEPRQQQGDPTPTLEQQQAALQAQQDAHVLQEKIKAEQAAQELAHRQELALAEAEKRGPPPPATTGVGSNPTGMFGSTGAGTPPTPASTLKPDAKPFTPFTHPK